MFGWKQYKITFFGKMISQVFSILEDIYIAAAHILLESYSKAVSSLAITACGRQPAQGSYVYYSQRECQALNFY